MTTKRVSRLEKKMRNGEEIHVILYCRVSGQAQEDKGSSLETQEDDTRTYADDCGYTVVDVVKEVHTGKELDQRRKLRDVMLRCERMEADAIIVRTQDRLARNTTHEGVIMYEAEKHGYTILCVKEPYNDEDPIARVTHSILAAVAELELSKIQGRTTEGKRKRAQNGARINSKHSRYGYRSIDLIVNGKAVSNGAYAINEDEAEVIRYIDRLYLDGYSQLAISSQLQKDGYKSPVGEVGKWTSTAIHRILNCTEYHGEGYAYTQEKIVSSNGKPSHRVRPVEEWIRLPIECFPVIRSYETYQAIQERSKTAHSSGRTSNLPSDVLLRGYVFCSICGSRMYPTMRRGKVAYKCGKENEDHTITMLAEKLDTAVIEFLRGLLRDLSTIDKALTSYLQTHSATSSTESYDHAIERVREEMELLNEDKRTTKGYARQLIMDEMNKKQAMLDDLEKCKREVRGDTGKWDKARRDIEDLLTWLRSGEVDIDTASFKVKRDMLESLGIAVIVYKDECKRVGTTCEVKALPIGATLSDSSSMDCTPCSTNQTRQAYLLSSKISLPQSALV